MRDPATLTSDELVGLVEGARWFASKGRAIESAEVVGVPVHEGLVALAIVEVTLRRARTSTTSSPSARTTSRSMPSNGPRSLPSWRRSPASPPTAPASGRSTSSSRTARSCSTSCTC
jgi:hypothetical protein